MIAGAALTKVTLLPVSLGANPCPDGLQNVLQLKKAWNQRFLLGTMGQHNPGAKVKQQTCINKATPVKAMWAAEEKR